MSGAFDAGAAVLYLWLSVGGLNFADVRVFFTIFILNGIHLVLFIAAMVTFLIWLVQAHDNVRYLRGSQMKWPQALAVAGFFIPVANLLIPYLVMQEIWRGSDPETSEPDELDPHRPANSPLILAWAIVWNLLWVGFTIAFQIFKRPFNTGFWVASIFVLILPIPATFAILIIRAIVRRQEKRWQALIGENIDVR